MHASRYVKPQVFGIALRARISAIAWGSACGEKWGLSIWSGLEGMGFLTV